MGKGFLPPYMKREDFLREIARRANFTIQDVRIIWQTVESIFRDAIECKTDLNIYGFGRLSTRKAAGRKSVHPKTGEPIVYPPYERIKFRLSRNYRDLKKPVELKRYYSAKRRLEKIEEYYGNSKDKSESEEEE